MQNISKLLAFVLCFRWSRSSRGRSFVLNNQETAKRWPPVTRQPISSYVGGVISLSTSITMYFIHWAQKNNIRIQFKCLLKRKKVIYISRRYWWTWTACISIYIWLINWDIRFQANANSRYSLHWPLMTGTGSLLRMQKQTNKKKKQQQQHWHRSNDCFIQAICKSVQLVPSNHINVHNACVSWPFLWIKRT